MEQEKTVLEFDEGIHPKHIDLHTTIAEACKNNNWDIQCRTAALKRIRLHSARLTDLEALKAYMFLIGTYHLGDMFAMDDSFHFWVARK